MPELRTPPGAKPALSERKKVLFRVSSDLWHRRRRCCSREKESADFKAMELELLEGIRTTQAAQVKLQQDIVNAGGQVSSAVFLQRPSKAMKAFSEVMIATCAHWVRAFKDISGMYLRLHGP